MSLRRSQAWPKQWHVKTVSHHVAYHVMGPEICAHLRVGHGGPLALALKKLWPVISVNLQALGSDFLAHPTLHHRQHISLSSPWPEECEYNKARPPTLSREAESAKPSSWNRRAGKKRRRLTRLQQEAPEAPQRAVALAARQAVRCLRAQAVGRSSQAP